MYAYVVLYSQAIYIATWSVVNDSFFLILQQMIK